MSIHIESHHSHWSLPHTSSSLESAKVPVEQNELEYPIMRFSQKSAPYRRTQSAAAVTIFLGSASSAPKYSAEVLRAISAKQTSTFLPVFALVRWYGDP